MTLKYKLYNMKLFMTIVIICGLLVCCKNKKNEENVINKDSIITLTNNDTNLYENERVILTKEFQVKDVPNPFVHVAGKRFGQISKNVLLAQSGVRADIVGLDISGQFKISEYTLTTISRKGKIVENISKSNNFTEAQIIQLKNLSSGDKVYFENIKIILPSGKEKNTGSFMLKIE